MCDDVELGRYLEHYCKKNAIEFVASENAPKGSAVSPLSIPHIVAFTVSSLDDQVDGNDWDNNLDGSHRLNGLGGEGAAQPPIGSSGPAALRSSKGKEEASGEHWRGAVGADHDDDASLPKWGRVPRHLREDMSSFRVGVSKIKGAGKGRVCISESLNKSLSKSHTLS